MTFLFLFTCLVVYLILVLPGCVVLKALGLDIKSSLILGPVVTCAMFLVVSLFLGVFLINGIPPLALGVTILTAVLSLLLLGLRYRFSWTIRCPRLSWGLMALYVCFGLLCAWRFYMANMFGYDNFLQSIDNTAHLGRIRAMEDGSSTSPLREMLYGANTNQAQNIYPDYDGLTARTGYYPVAYHQLGALTLALGFAPLAMVQNAVNVIYTAVVYPLGFYLLMAKLASARWITHPKALLVFGAFMSWASYFFPLRNFVVLQIYPSACGVCLLLLSFYLLLQAIPQENGGAVTLDKKYMILWAVSLMGLFAMHPCMCIAVCVAAAAYGAGCVLPRLVRIRWSDASISRVILWECLFIFACCGLWVVLLLSPVFAGVVSFLWEFTIPLSEAIINVLTMGLRYSAPQWFLAVALWIGLIWCITHKELRWLAVAWVLFAVIFIANVAGDPTIKRVFSGFFYTDSERTGALLSLWSVFIATFGLYACLWLLDKGLNLIHKPGKTSLPAARRWEEDSVAMLGGPQLYRGPRLLSTVFAAIILGVFAVGNYEPAFTASLIPMPEGHLYPAYDPNIHRSPYAWEEQELRWVADTMSAEYYQNDDAAFMKKVKEITGDKDLIINEPFDGSMYAYAIDDVNVLYRRGFVRDTEASQQVRYHLKDYAWDPAVQKAVKDLGAKYILMLSSKGPYRGNFAATGSHLADPKEWAGINDITPETPGFRLLLSDGDMALYEIENPEEAAAQLSGQTAPRAAA